MLLENVSPDDIESQGQTNFLGELHLKLDTSTRILWIVSSICCYSGFVLLIGDDFESVQFT